MFAIYWANVIPVQAPLLVEYRTFRIFAARKIELKICQRHLELR